MGNKCKSTPMKNRIQCIGTHSNACEFDPNLKQMLTHMSLQNCITITDLRTLSDYKAANRDHLHNIVVNHKANILASINPNVTSLLPLAFQIFKTPYIANVHRCDDNFTELCTDYALLMANDHLKLSHNTECELEQFSERRAFEYCVFEDEDTDKSTTIVSDSMTETHILKSKKCDGVISQMRNGLFDNIVQNRFNLDFDLSPTAIDCVGNQMLPHKIDYCSDSSNDSRYLSELEIHSRIMYDYNMSLSKQCAYQIELSFITTHYLREKICVVRYDTSSILDYHSWSHRDRLAISITNK